MSVNSNHVLAQQYQQKTDKQHILDNPDTYIGSVENVDANLWVFDDAAAEPGRITLKTIEYVPGLYKLFDEGIVNCRDHVIRMIQSKALDKKLVTSIDVSVQEDGTITMMNDGNGIDVAKHPEYNVWIPEMIFGQLRTSTNYNKDEERIVGGKNGFGFKLVLIWSTYGYVETVDHTRGLKYTQEFKNNLSELGTPVITKIAKSVKPYTKVIFKPDYTRFGMPGGLTSDMMALLKKRTYDVAAVTDQSQKKIKVTYNGLQVPVKNFQQYIDMYIGIKDLTISSTLRVYESPGDSEDSRWEYAVALSPTHEFLQVSFVNGICTTKGGKHVDYILGQITRKLAAYIEKKKKVTVNANSIKEQLILFLRCDIVNPAFDSQTKDYMNTPSNKFGSSCIVSDAFIEKVAKMGVMDLACSLTEAKENRMAKKTDGSKTRTIRGIANFIDANYSGTPDKSKDCTLILCEGLSALSGIVSGLSSEDRNVIGIYPLKGKLLNIRGEQAKKIAENKEISDLKKILGLETGKEYKTMADVHRHLRYGKVMFLTDADLDGSHIKGLCINAFHSAWQSLAMIPGFLSFMNTPILRAKRGQQTLLFYNDGEYDAWKRTLPNQSTHGWTIKYFKGLGTSTAVEFKEYFANKKVVDFVHNGAPSDNSIDKVFNKKRPDDRKVWLENYDKHAFLNTSLPKASYDDFIDLEMRHFSTYDCARSIPNMVDGLKTSLRKILYSAFKRRLTTEIKVAQFSGYVSETSAYHHGEASLNGAIVNMAQNFVGSNNIHLLEPCGQFGTRMLGGDDSASERYIYTYLSPLTRALFPELDDPILQYLNDDGTIVEPEFYVPILPFCLVNGISGIGTGFSSSIPAYSPKTMVQYLRAKLREETYVGPEFVPYYEGFKGQITVMGPHKYLVRGVYEKMAEDKIRITELPVGTWTMSYVAYLETLVDGVVDKAGKKAPPILKDFTSVSTDTLVDITVQFPKGKLVELETKKDENGITGLEKLLKLTTTLSTTNMHLFDANCRLHKYTDVCEIIDAHYPIRLATYKKRKDYLVQALQQKLTKLSNRVRYIQETLDDVVDLRKKTAQQVTDLLTARKFDPLEGDFNYLIKMPMNSVTQEHVESLQREHRDTSHELRELQATTLEQMWLHELDVFDNEYVKYQQKRAAIQSGESAPKSRTIKAPKAPKIKS
jgi:DNA topoisomerase-2